MPRKNTGDDQNLYATLKREVLDLGFLRRGTVTRRFMPCGKPGCCCLARPPELHGPYYQWTRKVKGKTKTVRLTPEQAKLVENWIANGRQLDTITRKMERVSLRATDRLLKHVPK